MARHYPSPPPPDQGQQGSALLKPTGGSHWLNGVGEEDIRRGGGALNRNLHGVSEGLGTALGCLGSGPALKAGPRLMEGICFLLDYTWPLPTRVRRPRTK